MLHAVIMAGGSGTRFWPRSRQRRPKQLIRIVGTGTMIQQTVARLRRELPPEAILVVTNATQADDMRRQLPDLAHPQIIAEPCGRDTAACIGLAAFLLRKSDPEAVMAVFSADHVIGPPEELFRCVKEAVRICSDHGALVTFGIRPSEPSELYGYIRRGERLPAQEDAPPAFGIAEFREKPDRSQAEQYVRSGEYYWNSGNFVWRVADICESIRQFLPDLHAGLEKIEPALGTPQQQTTLAREYPRLPRVSIDYGVMERASNTAVVEASFQWDDVGSWESIARHHEGNGDGNVVVGEHAGVDTSDCILVAEDGHLVATVGVRDLIVVHTPDATLVCDRRRAGDVKKLVSQIKEKGLEAYL